MPALIAEWLERSDAYHWIARCCSIFGATAFYSRRGAVPVVAGEVAAGEVAAIVNAWIAAQPLRWLRALRPPQHRCRRFGSPPMAC